MDLSLNEHQEMLRSTVAGFMAHECPKSVLLDMEGVASGAPKALWDQVARLGWTGMLIPAEYGGAGSSLLDTAVVFEQFGRGPLPGPFFSSGVLGALIVMEAGSEDQRKAFLPGIASGERVVTLAVLEPERRWGPEAVQMQAAAGRDGLVLNGVKSFVHDAVAATHFIVAVRTRDVPAGEDGISLVLVDRALPGVGVRPLSGFMGWVGEVRLEDVRVPVSQVLGAPGDGWAPLERAVQAALPVLCAYQVGGCDAVFTMSVDYSRDRVQFGQPIGRFQRVQDHIINIANAMDAARWTTYEAIWKLERGVDGRWPPGEAARDAARSVHLAKVVSSDGYYHACNSAHEVHAGIGVSREYGLTLHTRMSRTLFQHLGDPAYHKRRLADALL